MARKSGDDASSQPTSKVAATVMLSLGRNKATHEFDEVTVSTDDPAHVTVMLSAEDGRKIAVMLPRSEVKRLISWRMIMSL